MKSTSGSRGKANIGTGLIGAILKEQPKQHGGECHNEADGKTS